MEQDKVFKGVTKERQRQDARWGTVEEHPHEIGAWITILRSKLNDAEKAWMKDGDDASSLKEITQIAAVAVACLEQHL